MTDPKQPSDAPAPAPAGTPRPQPSERALMARLEEIERSEARLRRLATVNAVGVAALIGIAAGLFYFATKRGAPGTVADVVESREYRLRDRDGQVRGAWGFAEDGAIRLVLQNAGDQRALRLHLLPDGSAGVTFNDSTGAARIVLGLLPDGNSSLVFADHLGTARSVYSFTPGGAATLIFADRRGTTRAVLGVDASGNTLMSGDAAVPAPEEEAGDSAAGPVPAEQKKR